MASIKLQPFLDREGENKRLSFKGTFQAGRYTFRNYIDSILGTWSLQEMLDPLVGIFARPTFGFLVVVVSVSREPQKLSLWLKINFRKKLT